MTAYGLPMLQDPESYEIRGRHVLRVSLAQAHFRENSTGHILRAAAERMFLQHTALSSGTVSVCQKVWPSNGPPYRVGWDSFDRAGGHGPRSETALYFCTPVLPFVAPIVYSKGLYRHDAPSMEPFRKCIILEMKQHFLASPNKPLLGVTFSDRHPGVP